MREQHEQHEQPTVTLGVLWGALLVAALFAGAGWLAIVLAPTAALAAVQTARTWRRADAPPIEGMTGLGAAAVVLGAIGGFVGLLVATALVGLAAAALERTIAARHKSGQVRRPRSLSRTLWIVAVVGLGAAAPVLLRARSSHGAVVTLALCTYALVYDASAFVIGSDAGNQWEGPLAGLASIGAVTVAVAAVLVPPFKGGSPWVLGIVAALTTPLGPWLVPQLVGQVHAPIPALRRLDSLLVLGPVWALLALALVG